MATPGPTPSQTLGPFFAMKMAPVTELASPSIAGERIRIIGSVRDGDRQIVDDALVEVWQADAAGRYRHPAAEQTADAPVPDASFTGYGRSLIDVGTGVFTFDTIKPGRVINDAGGRQAPHLSLIVTGRGLLKPCHTRLYFADEQAANERDAVLASVPTSRRATLLAEPTPAEPITTYRFDIRLQGEDETVFFAL